MSEATTMNFLVPIGKSFGTNKLPAINVATIEDYIAYVNAIPMLEEHEELECTQKLQQYGDLQAAHRLVMAHLRYVVKIAKKYLGYGLPLADLIQEGTVGLMKAVRKFNPEKKVRLVTFAMHWIKAEIHEFILKNWRIVKIATTKAQRKLFFKLKKNKKGINWLNNQEVQQIATDLNVKTTDVKQMEMRMFGKDSCFDNLLPSSQLEQGKSLVPVNYLSAENLTDSLCVEDFRFNPEAVLEKTQWENVAFSKLYGAILKLDSRSQEILRKRWLQNDEKVTLEDLALEYGVSKERIRQLEKQAILELRKYF